MTTLSLRTAFGALRSAGDHRLGIAQAFDRLLSWYDRAHERAHLRSLDDHMLKDIGISRADVEVEASKPFWRP